MRYVNHPEYKEFASRLQHAVVNIRAIVHHFRPRIDKWSKDNNLTTLTEEEVGYNESYIYIYGCDALEFVQIILEGIANWLLGNS